MLHCKDGGELRGDVDGVKRDKRPSETIQLSDFCTLASAAIGLFSIESNGSACGE